MPCCDSSLAADDSSGRPEPESDPDPENEEVQDHYRGRKKRPMHQPNSIQHLLTHLPKHPLCPTCQRVKMTRKPARRRPPPEAGEIPKAFGDHLTADHVIAYNDASTSLAGDTVALMVRDLGTGCRCMKAQKGKTAKETFKNLQNFIGTKQEASYIYTDGSKELAEAPKVREAFCAAFPWFSR